MYTFSSLGDHSIFSSLGDHSIFSSLGDHSIPKSAECSHSATKLDFRASGVLGRHLSASQVPRAEISDAKVQGFESLGFDLGRRGSKISDAAGVYAGRTSEPFLYECFKSFSIGGL